MKRYSEAGRTYPETSLDPALEVACPLCEVAAGKPCIDGSGRPVHPARRAASYQARYPSHAGASER